MITTFGQRKFTQGHRLTLGPIKHEQIQVARREEIKQQQKQDNIVHKRNSRTNFKCNTRRRASTTINTWYCCFNSSIDARKLCDLKWKISIVTLLIVMLELATPLATIQATAALNRHRHFDNDARLAAATMRSNGFTSQQRQLASNGPVLMQRRQLFTMSDDSSSNTAPASYHNDEYESARVQPTATTQLRHEPESNSAAAAAAAAAASLGESPQLIAASEANADADKDIAAASVALESGSNGSGATNENNDDDELADDSHNAPPPVDSLTHTAANSDDQYMLERHKINLRAMHDMFERRQLMAPTSNNQHHHQHHHLTHQSHSSSNAPLQSSQELSPISIGLDPGGPFGLGGPFSMGAPGPDSVASPPAGSPMPGHPHKPQMSNADNLDPTLPFGLNPLPHLLGFQGGPPGNGFDGPQRGDQSAHSNQHTSVPAGGEPDAGPGSPKVWPKIFRFTDGRINLSDFEKHKKIRLSNKNQHGGENHIESAPIMFDGRQLKRKSFLILHGGIFSRR